MSGAAGNAIVSSISYTLPTSINILSLSGYANLTATGNSASDTITANSGNDTLTAASGVAQLIGGTGADLFVINNTADAVSSPDYGLKSGAQAHQSSVSYTLPSQVSTLLLTGTAALTAVGNSHADWIVGNAGTDTLDAGAGNDTLVAGAGLATLVGSVGNDTFIVNATGDVVEGGASSQNNAIVSAVSFSLPANVDTMILSGTGNLRAVGNGDNDSIMGNAGADTLIAGSGTDTLVAGAGVATLLGGREATPSSSTARPMS